MLKHVTYSSLNVISSWSWQCFEQPRQFFFFITFQKRRVLYIFAGQRSKEYLNDFFMYHVDNGQIEILLDGSQKDVGPSGSRDISGSRNYHIRQFMKDPSTKAGGCLSYSSCIYVKEFWYSRKRSYFILE